MTRTELILYATPTGPSGDALAHLFAEIRATASTTAQEYPPHCTLTGFFSREPSQIGRIVGELEAAAAEVGSPSPVAVTALHRRPDWIGLELRSPWLVALTAGFVRHHRLLAGDDALRPKTWLHLSIAYGVADLAAAAALVGADDHQPPMTWEVDIWERGPDRRWTRHPTGITSPG